MWIGSFVSKVANCGSTGQYQLQGSVHRSGRQQAGFRLHAGSAQRGPMPGQLPDSRPPANVRRRQGGLHRRLDHQRSAGVALRLLGSR